MDFRRVIYENTKQQQKKIFTSQQTSVYTGHSHFEVS